MFRVAHPVATRWAGKNGQVRRGRDGGALGAHGLPGEPFLEAGTAEGVQTVEEGKRLIEEVGADLALHHSQQQVPNFWVYPSVG